MVTINIDETIYVAGHYEIKYTVDSGSQYQTQFYAKEGVSTQSLLDAITNAYTLQQTGINFTNISELPVPPEVVPPTQAELDKVAQEVVVEDLKIQKDNLSMDLEILYGYLDKIESLISLANVTIDPSQVVDARHEENKALLISKMTEFNTIYTNYHTEKATLEGM